MENPFDAFARSALKAFIGAAACLVAISVFMLAINQPFAAGIAAGALLTLSIQLRLRRARLRRISRYFADINTSLDAVTEIPTREGGHENVTPSSEPG